MAEATAEIEKFNRLAASWWDPKGPMAPLHWMNPARLDFIYRHLAQAGTGKGASGLDIGCGAGLLTEPLARYGFRMTGLDGAADAIAVARQHAIGEQLKIDYNIGHSDTDILLNKKFDFVTALEIIEHVDDPEAFLASCAEKLPSGGILFVSTLNRTFKSRIFSVYLAEYIIRALPVGTHDPTKFIRPSELTQMLDRTGFDIVELNGMVFQPWTRSFKLSAHDLDINYIVCARKR